MSRTLDILDAIERAAESAPVDIVNPGGGSSVIPRNLLLAALQMIRMQAQNFSSSYNRRESGTATQKLINKVMRYGGAAGARALYGGFKRGRKSYSRGYSSYSGRKYSGYTKRSYYGRRSGYSRKRRSYSRQFTI